MTLEAEVQRLQRQVDEQAGELKVLVTFFIRRREIKSKVVQSAQ